MNFQFTHREWLLLLPLAVAWVIWLALRSDVQIHPWRRWSALTLRLGITLGLVLALAGLQWRRPVEGMNVIYLLDRSQSIPSPQQEAARQYAVTSTAARQKDDQAGVLVFGSDSAIDRTLTHEKLELPKIEAVIDAERTDVAGAIRLGTAAFPETGQKRLVLLSDGNENAGDALQALLSARPLGVTLDVVPLGIQRGHDVSVQKLGLPARIKKAQTFEAKIFVNSDLPTNATVRLYRNEQPLGEQQVQLEAGKNLFTFPQSLSDPGFYTYTVYVEAAGDEIPQNNRATSFVNVRGEPRVLLVSAAPGEDATLAAALRSGQLDVRLADVSGWPKSLAEMGSYDSIFLSNLAAGDIGQDAMKLIESAVRDFGVGLVCIGGDQAFAAGGYRGTPLETTLPVNMDLDSKKVLPNGAIALVMHGMEFMNGNQIARECALGVLDALGPQDEMGVVLWDGFDQWLFPMQKVGDRKKPGRLIAGMNQGDLPSFQNVMAMGFEGLKKSSGNLKHMIIFSDGDPVPPSEELMKQMAAAKVTVSTVLIAGHAGPDTMMWIAEQGRGRFYNIQNPSQLPQIFIKETAVILKSAIYEEPFRPKMVAASEVVKAIAPGEFPTLRGYVGSTAKPRAEVPLLTDKGDPLLAHWQYGLGRAVAFTSDAKARWARDWLNWGKFQQFWLQAAQWSLRRVENADFTTEVSLENGEGHVSVEALDEKGEYRNFLTLQSVVVSPKGERTPVRLEQTGPGRYEARFPTREVGSYLLNLMDIRDGKVAGAQVVGASVNYSPEFTAPEPNFTLLRRLAELGGGRLIDPRQPAASSFLHGRQKTFQPRDLWEGLLRIALVLFVLDVGIRRILLGREELAGLWALVSRLVLFWQPRVRPAQADESLAALLVRREQVRSAQTAAAPPARPELFQPRAPAPASPAPPAETRPVAPSAPPGAAPAEDRGNTTGRLLDAKRRARRK